MVGVTCSGGMYGYKLFLKEAEVCVSYMKKNLNEAQEQELADIVRDYLDARAADVVLRYYGIAREKETLEQIGKLYNMSANGIRSIRVRAMRNVRHSGARETLAKFYNDLP